MSLSRWKLLPTSLALFLVACGPEPAADTETDEEEVASPVGRTYALDLAEGVWVQPEGFHEFLLTYLDTQPLFAVPAADAETFDLRWSASAAETSPPIQDACVATSSVEGVALDADLSFAFRADLPLVVDESATLIVGGGRFSGRYAIDRSELVDVQWTGQLDARDMATDEDPDPRMLCEIWIAMGDECTACSTDGEVFCIPFDVHSVHAPEAPSAAPLLAITEAEVSANPECP